MNEVTVNMDNLTTEEREQLLALAEKGNKKPFEVPKPLGGTDGLVLCGDGCISRGSAFAYHGRGLWAKTEEELKFIDQQRIILTQYKRLAAESWAGEVIDWSDYDVDKWELCFRDNELDYTKIYNGRYVGGVYFKTEESIKSAIKTIGEENIIKYLFQEEI